MRLCATGFGDQSLIPCTKRSRAEAGDVANSVPDGEDAVMLGGETATKDHPLHVVEIMARIIKATDSWVDVTP